MRGSRPQTGASNCGATAVSTQLAALKVKNEPHAEVVVRARDHSTRSLLTYLRSRSKAGCTADDLVNGATALSGGRCVARFYPTGPAPPEDLSAWLAKWIAIGAAPIATINTQLDGADYWHHQAVLGVRPHDKQVMLANPAEKVDESELARLLGSDSVMLIFPDDVLRLCPPSAADMQSMRDDRAWAKLQVAEQVEGMMNKHGGAGGRGSDGKLMIPASYTPGLTLIAMAGSPAAARMEAGGEPPPWQRR